MLGLDPQDDRDELRQQLGIQLQESQLPDRLRVGEALELFAAFYDEPADTGSCWTYALGTMTRRIHPQIIGASGVPGPESAVAARRWSCGRRLLTISQSGGASKLTASGLGIFAVIFAINAGVAGAEAWFGWVGNEQKLRRQRASRS